MNKAIFTGNLTKDPEKRTTQHGTSVTSFTVAVQRRFKNQNGNYDADFINCVAWRGTADFVAQYFSKGSRIGAQMRNPFALPPTRYISDMTNHYSEREF